MSMQFDDSINSLPKPEDLPPIQMQPRAFSRFKRTTEDVRKRIINKSQSQSTHKSTTTTKSAIKVFREWLLHNGMDGNFESLLNQDLNNALEIFYTEARAKDGRLYSKNTLLHCRSALNSYLQRPPFKRTCILRGEDFSSSNRLLKVLKLTRPGDFSYPEIIFQDLQKIKSATAFNVNDPTELQQKVFFDLQFHFVGGGRLRIRSLTKNSFVVKKDERQIEYIEMCDDTQDSVDYALRNCMNATGTDNCPVESYKKYLSKLHPMSQVLFCQVKKCKGLNAMNESFWYKTAPHGVNTISGFMKGISKRLQLSQVYRNYSIVKTALTVAKLQSRMGPKGHH